MPATSSRQRQAAVNFDVSPYGNLPGVALKLTYCELVLNPVKCPIMTDTETNIVHFTLGQPWLEGDLHLIGLLC